VNEAHARAREILEERKEQLDRLGELLMVREVLEGKELKTWVEGEHPIPDADEERRRIEAEHEARMKKAEEEEARKREEQERARATQEIPPAPHAADPTEELERS
jgi:cell division protease FtsH